MGEVYRAEDPLLHREVAVKRLPPRLRRDPQYREQLCFEAQRASALDCPHIAAVYDVVEERDEVLLVLEFVRGGTLRCLVGQPLALDVLLDIAAQCAEALAAAHEKRILHRDIKPDNIMLTPGGQVKVLDFGVAKRLRPAGAADTVSVFGNFAGTPGYMAPEVLLDEECDERADIFSLGVVLWELATGRHPFFSPGEPRTAARVLHAKPPSLCEVNPALPPELDAILQKMLAREREERYAGAREILDDLRSLQRATATGTLPRHWVGPRWKRRLRVIVPVLLLVMVVAPLLNHLRSGRTLLPQQKFVAVLPFRTVAADAETQALSDGLTQTLTAKLSELSTVPGLQVAPSREVYSRHIASPGQARELLGANLVLDGSLHRVGNTVRITYAVIDAARNRQLRAETITADASDVFGVEDRVVEAAITMLDIELAPPHKQRLRQAGTANAEAYAAFLKAQGYLQHYDQPQNLRAALTALERATTLDPKFADAFAAQGLAHWYFYIETHDPQWIGAARQNCLSAVAANPNSPAGHMCQGFVLQETGEFQAAVAEFRRALDLDPASDEALRGLGMALQKLRRFDEAESTYRRAIALHPSSWSNQNQLGRLYLDQSRYDDAIAAFNTATVLAPDSFRAYYNLGGAYTYAGRYDEARAALEKSLSLHRTSAALSNLGSIEYLARNYEKAAAYYAEAAEMPGAQLEVLQNLADALQAIPRRTEAKAAYQRAIAAAEKELAIRPRDPALLIQAARFHAIIGEIEVARNLLSRGLATTKGDPQHLANAAYVSTILGDKNGAVALIQRAVAAGYPRESVRDAPHFAELRKDSRVQALIKGDPKSRR